MFKFYYMNTSKQINNKATKIEQQYQPPSSETNSYLLKILLPLKIVAIINLILSLLNGFGSLVLESGLGGFALAFFLPITGIILCVISFILISYTKKYLKDNKQKIAYIYLGTVIFINFWFLLSNINLISKWETVYSGHVIMTELENKNEVDYEYCKTLINSPGAYSSCTQKLAKQGDLLGCLKLSYEFTNWDIVCIYNGNYFGSHLLNDNNMLEKAMYIWENNLETISERDQKISEKATTFNDCMEIYRPQIAQSCANRLLKENQDIVGCVEFSNNYQKETEKFLGKQLKTVKRLHGEIGGGVIDCYYKDLVFKGADFDGNEDFETIINMNNLIKEAGLYLDEYNAKNMARNKYKCDGFRLYESGDQNLTEDVQTAMDYLNIDKVYRPCELDENFIQDGA